MPGASITDRIRNFVRPYLVPVPLQRTTFVDVRTGDTSELSLLTDLSSIRTYDAQHRVPEEALIGYGDIQLDLFCGHHGRLGSGRAVFYAGKYLKGVGRTQLALNWNQAGHSCGSLSPSRALRELLASDYARKHGLESVVLCEQVSLRELPPELRVEGGTHDRLAADDALHAISVKPDEFVRASNLVYLLTTLPFPITGSTFERCLFLALHSLHQGFLHGGAGWYLDAEPPELDALLDPDVFSDFLERTWRNMSEHLRHGFRMGSTQNNYTLDGRALDIELVTISGTLDVAELCLEYEESKTIGSHDGVDFDVFPARRELEYSIRFIARQLEAAAGAYHLPERFRASLRSYVSEIEKRLTESWVSNDDLFIARFMRLFRDESTLVPDELAFLESAVNVSHGRDAPERTARLVPICDVPHDDGQNLGWFYGFIGERDPRSKVSEAYRAMETTLQRMSAAGNLDAVRAADTGPR